MTIPDPYGRSMFHGKLLDNATIAALKIAERRLGYELTITQGIGGAAASAGTHLEGRVVDLSDWDAADKLRVLKLIGFAIWERTPVPGLWPGHLHGCLMFEGPNNSRGIADSALRQIGSFLRGRDGLVGDGPDPHGWRPEDSPVVFSLAEYRQAFEKPEPQPERTPITRARNRIVEARHALGVAIARLEDAPKDREVARNQIDDLRRMRRNLTATLERMPKR